jgi:dTDP-4-amino-4,6-dideoxygalactose transaminase
LYNSRDKVFRKLKENGICVQVHYIPVYYHLYYRMMGYTDGLCPNAEEYFNRAISLPLYPSLEREDMEYVVEKVCETVRGI